MRVLVYNVRGFRAGPTIIAEVVRDLQPDLALITECGTARQLERFSRSLNMRASHGSLLPIARRARNAILVREPLSVIRAEMHLFTGAALFHPRGALVAEVKADARFTAIVVHLGLSRQERIRHAEELIALVGTADRPALIGGDLNEGPRGPAVAAIAAVGRDAWTDPGDGATFPAGEPTARIDYLFASEDVEIKRTFVPGEPALGQVSDHLPLVVDLAL